ncbi:MAG: ABC transporter ATP-binding protein [Planctomycetota bacterium]
MRVSARDVTFAYRGGPTVLRRVSFAAGEGEVVGVFGPNGSGKTTLLRCLSGELEPQQGEVRLDGRPVSAYSGRERARRLAVVPQEGRADLGFSALEVVLFGRYPMLGFWESESERDLAAAQAAMEATESWRLRDRRFDELSGGERQRVVIARALAQEPGALLLDEPTVHLDLCHQLALYSLARRLAEERELCVVAVCHDLFVAPASLDRAVVLHAGCCVADGPPREVLTAPLLERVFGVARLPWLERALPLLWGAEG